MSDQVIPIPLSADELEKITWTLGKIGDDESRKSIQVTPYMQEVVQNQGGIWKIRQLLWQYAGRQYRDNLDASCANPASVQVSMANVAGALGLPFVFVPYVPPGAPLPPPPVIPPVKLPTHSPIEIIDGRSWRTDTYDGISQRMELMPFGAWVPVGEPT